MHGDVERRQAVLEDPPNVALANVGERREVAVRERQAVVVLPQVQWRTKAWRQAFDETELAAIRALPHGRWLEFHSHRVPVPALHFVYPVLAIRLARFDHQLFVGAQELPVEKIGDPAAVDGQQLGPALHAKRGGNAAPLDTRDPY